MAESEYESIRGEGVGREVQRRESWRRG